MENDLNVYDEQTNELLEPPFDYTKGKLYKSIRFVAHHEAQEEVSHEELMLGTEHMNGGKGLYSIVIDQEAKDAWDEYEDCLIWHTFTEEELASGGSTGIVLEDILAAVDQKVSDGIVAAVALSKGG